MNKRPPVVAIDGPAGSGKSTVAKRLATRLAFKHIDTGALYRGVALLAIRANISLSDQDAVANNCAAIKFEFKVSTQGNELFLAGENVAKEIRDEAVGQGASKVSAYPKVRALLLGLQRDLGSQGGAVLEGRDIGTVVFPDAEFKFFVTASVDERAKRRMSELAAGGQNVPLEDVRQAIIERDHSDSTRAIAPLKQAADARLIDTTSMTVDEVIDTLERIIRSHA